MSFVDARTQQLQAPSTALVTKHGEDPKQDIIAERQRASFDAQQLLYWLNGGKDKVDRRCVCVCSVYPICLVVVTAGDSR